MPNCYFCKKYINIYNVRRVLDYFKACGDCDSQLNAAFAVDDYEHSQRKHQNKKQKTQK